MSKPADPVFRSSFAETIFGNKYSHKDCETFRTLSRTLIEDVCRGFMNEDEKRELFEIHASMQAIAGGRYLYYAGRPAKAFNNCLGGETRIYTDKGLRRLDSFENGESVNVLSPVTGGFLSATAHSHGTQRLNKITFAPIRGKSKKKWVVRATRTHHWPLIGGGDTYDLRIGDVIPAGGSSYRGSEYYRGFIHGMIFADGTQTRSRDRDGMNMYQIRLCGEKSKFSRYIEKHSDEFTIRKNAENGDPIYSVGSLTRYKDLPREDADPGYKAGFASSWVLFDGHKDRMIHSIDVGHIEWFAENAPLAGYMVTGGIVTQSGLTNFAPNGRKPIHRVNFCRCVDWGGFKVVDIEEDLEEEVFCPFEPIHNRIVIEGGIDSFQCYLLRSEEDTREDWAMLSWKAESCLTTGGGIGNDYSIYRGRGARLSRTGGYSSGPVSKAKMINEIGREVMQGGSRRSAIYASLDCGHSDAIEFLTVKDWDNQIVAGTSGLSVGDLKRADFNYPAPLDMTNISLNYSDDWLKDPFTEIFLRNVEMACRNGEPGFSFNFGDKANETLRNACTEVTSEDDSDVCNLASLNMARIVTIDQFRRAVILMTKFLLCGTLVAHLPYEKVYKVRERNRRLGLGLMGVHEWLLARGYRYEMVPELREWMEVYRDVSNETAAKFADELGVSRPIACRAIAPTGTIGLMAGTTTGIEPIFAVAYKRRYLKNGTDWHFQYVVDSTAQTLIDMYGVDPNSIETALDLSQDWERRIAFQADVQDYVDMGISSTINIPPWGSELNNETRIRSAAETLVKYAPRLRGFTVYPDGARGGQPLTSVPYHEAVANLGKEFREGVVSHDICDISGRGGTCGV